jgi:gluconokinase
MGAVQKNVGGLNLGSSGAIRVVSKQPLLDREMRFFCYYIASKNWLVGGAVNNCGIILRWFRDNFGQKEIEQAKERNIDVYRLLDEQAAKAPPGSDGLLFLPFMAGERFPIRDPNVRGMLFGLDLAHGKPDIIRCMMEGVTFTLRWILEAIEEHVELDEIRISGGGARSALWRQIVSDVCGKKVVKTGVEEASSLGAAMLAGIAVGDFHDMEDASKQMVKGEMKVQEPSQQTHEYYNKLFELYKSTYSGCRTYCEKLLEIERERK